MRVLRTPGEMHAACLELKRAGQRLGFVPTMGALHEGHLSLVRAARARCQAVAVSIFVNPLQFGPNEDLAKYPRTFERDRQLLENEQVDLLFAPSNEDMYPPGAKTVVEVQELSGKLCGRSRPGHFRGVTTVVAKFFNIVAPDAAFFGQKDAAQAAILRRMVRDLDFGIEMVVCPIVREPDGLAMSSRNAYLGPAERKQALVLSRALRRVESLAQGGERRTAPLIEAAHEVFREEPEVRLDYIEIVDNDSLDPVADVSGGALVAVAAFVGSTRLIDNVLLARVA
jgi:pantoate--beta-alanine ligase